MSDDPVRLSLWLCKVLEYIGVSEDMRKMYRDTSIYSEIMWTITYRMMGYNYSQYRFGSSSEGTTTPDMGSDIDVVTVHESYPVIDDIQEAPSVGEASLMLTNSLGYVKLQRVLNGTPLTIHNHDIKDVSEQCDGEGRVCRKHLTHRGTHTLVTERNGPADTVISHPRTPPLDYVAAYRGKTFPQIATESLQKCIACGWMSRQDVDRMTRFGVLFVGVGCQTSPDRDIEWRMSFSLQERELTLALNPTQHKCYVMLKTIKKLITAHPDVENSLTSYHCKTCLFTVITDTSPTLWTEENLIQCTRICLSALKSWIYRGYCPNFFMNQNNMFDRHEFRQARERLLYYLRDALHEWPRLIYYIESDQLGEALRMEATQIDWKRTEHVYDILYRLCELTIRSQNNIIEYCQKLSSNQDISRYLVQQLRYLESIDTMVEHTQEQTQTALRRLKPFIHKLYAQHQASAAFCTEHPASRQRLLEISTDHIKQGKNCDLLSGKLLEATVLYKLGKIEACCSTLGQTERDTVHEAVVSLCLCYQSKYYTVDYLKIKVSSGYINLENIMESAVAPCMIFFPSQSEIIPKALQYEMYRSVYASSEFRNKYFMEWYHFAVVDSKIYLYFMQYIVYSYLNKPNAKRVAVDQILKTLDRDQNLCHRETAYNLLGWIYIQEEQLQDAVVCFCRSWQIRPDHNAAKWHMGVLLGRQVGLSRAMVPW